jgi:hypothetical protein
MIIEHSSRGFFFIQETFLKLIYYYYYYYYYFKLWLKIKNQNYFYYFAFSIFIILLNIYANENFVYKIKFKCIFLEHISTFLSV